MCSLCVFEVPTLAFSQIVWMARVGNIRVYAFAVDVLKDRNIGNNPVHLAGWPSPCTVDRTRH